MGERPGGPSGRSAALRDLLWILLGVFFIMVLGSATRVFEPFYGWVGERLRGQVGEAVGGLVLLAGGLSLFALVQGRSNRRESSARHLAESRYRALVERMPAVIYTWDPRPPAGTTAAPYVSPQIEQILGFTAQEWTDDPALWIRRVHDEDRDRVLAASDLADRTGEPLTIEYRHIRKDGRVIWLHDEAITIERDRLGRPSRSQGVMYDVTERKRAEHDLAETEARYRTLVERVPAVTYTWDAAIRGGDMAASFISPQVEELLGYSADEFRDPLLWSKIVHQDDLERVRAEWATCRQGEGAFSSEYRMHTRDGRELWVRDEAVPVRRDDDGNTLYQGVMFDITERKVAEQLLQKAEATYRTLIEQLPVVVYQDAIDDVSTALYISPQYERLFGFPPGARLRDPQFWVDHLHPDDRDRVMELSQWTNKTGEPFSAEYRFLGRDGRIVWVRDEAELLRDADGQPMMWQGVLLDVTARKHAEDALTRRDAVLQAIGFAAERFLKSVDWAAALPDVLERLGTASSAGRVYVFENVTLEDGRPGMRLYRQWFGQGIAGFGDGDMTTQAYEDGFERWRSVLSEGRELHGLTRDFPEHERRHLEGEGVLSRIVVPVSVGEEWWGFIGFDDCAIQRVWPAAEVEALKAAADTLGAAIGRTRAEHRRREEQAAREGLELRTSAVLASALEAIVTMDEHGRIVDFNPAAERMFGYGREDVAGEPLADILVPPELRTRHVAGLARFLETGHTTILGKHLEVEALRADGERLPIELTVTQVPMLDATLFTGFIRDLTERRNAEVQLNDAEQRYRTLVENLPAATYIDLVDEVSTTLYVSPQIESIWGYTQQEWTTDPDVWIDNLHPDDRDRVFEAIARHNEQGEPFEVEYRFRTKDGRWTWVGDHATVVRDDEGRLAFSQGAMFDVTERRQAEDQLREAEERYRAIVEHVPAAIYVDVPDGSMQSRYVSPQIEQIMGCTPEEFIDDPELWLDLMVDVQQREEMRATYVDAIHERRPSWIGEYLIRRRDGREVWVHDETTFVTDEHGQPLFLQGVMYDVTERKLAERALRESERREHEAAERLRAVDEMKNTFLAAVSHELRSPLTSILGLSLTLEQQPLPVPDQEELIGRLAVNARKLDRLLKDLLDIDRLSRGIVTPKVRPLDLASIVGRTVESLDVLDRRSILVQTETVIVPVDAPKIERIVENLVMNAVRHTEPDVGIWVRVWSQDGGAVIAVEDDGPGVPVALRQEIFEPFRQGPTTSPHSPGTGIGLSLVGMFAELHGGRAWIEDRVGGGASFRVFLPGDPADHGTGNGHDRGTPAGIASEVAG
jgi:PAS domain S-box-containing protein